MINTKKLQLLLKGLAIHKLLDQALLFKDNFKLEIIKEDKIQSIHGEQIALENIQTLEELKDAINMIDSPLKHLSTNLVLGTSRTDAKIMVIGEAPGEEEDKQGEPFVGQSGQLLEEIFNSIGLSREKNIYITNIVPWRPPANRTPTKEEMQLFLPYVIAHIKIIKPKLLILVGSTSYKALFNDSSPISKIRGQFLEYKYQDLHIPAFVLFHPSYLLRVPSNKKIMWEDMLKLQEYCLNNNLC